MSQSNYIWIDEAQDLSGMDLSGRDLSHMNLAGCTLSQTNLSGANLFRADLTGTVLFQADLSGANLNGTILDLPIHQFRYKDNHGHTYGTFFRYQGVYEQMYRWMSENLIQDKKELKAVREFLGPLIK